MYLLRSLYSQLEAIGGVRGTHARLSESQDGCSRGRRTMHFASP